MVKQTISVMEQVKGKAAVATEDGDSLFKVVSDLMDRDVCVTLDFAQIEMMTSTFLNAAIGQLYGKYKSPFLQAHLDVASLSVEDTELLKRVIERAKQYFKDRGSIEKPMKEAMDGE